MENVKTSRQRDGQTGDSVELKLSMLLILTAYLVYWIIIWQMNKHIKGQIC